MTTTDNKRPGWINMSKIVTEFFTPNDLLLSDEKLVGKYWFHCYGYNINKEFNPLIPLALRQNITANLL